MYIIHPTTSKQTELSSSSSTMTTTPPNIINNSSPSSQPFIKSTTPPSFILSTTDNTISTSTNNSNNTMIRNLQDIELQPKPYNTTTTTTTNHMITPTINDNDDEINYTSTKRICGGTCASANLRTLWVMFLLNTSFALAQLIASVVANSLSMASDSGTMLVDSFTYSVNLFVEYKKASVGMKSTSRPEVYAALFSVMVLIIVTSVMLSQAAQRMCCTTNLDNSVNGSIVVGFSSTNLIIDIIMCCKFLGQSRHWKSSQPVPDLVTTTKTEPNMASAFVHLFADTLRTLTSMIAGGLEIDATPRQTLYIDGLSTIIVCIVILLPATFVLYESIQAWKNLRAHENELQGMNDIIGESPASVELVSYQQQQQHQ
jgi:Co/Zn/Cd efflux system component